MLRRMLTDMIEQAVPPPPGQAQRAPVRREVVDASIAARARRPPPDEASAPRQPRREPAPPRVEAEGIARELASPSAVRRAILLMEILGPPASLRDPVERFRPE